MAKHKKKITEGKLFWKKSVENTDRTGGNALLTIFVIGGIILAFTVGDLRHPDKLLSESENRILAQKPELTVETILDGSFMQAYEDYITDQFVGRDKWITVKAYTDVALQKKDINGVYLGKDNYLIELHPREDYPEELVEKKLLLLDELVTAWNADVMLVPTADNILTEKYPASARSMVFDQGNFLEQVVEQIGEEHYIDVYTALLSNREQEIYYRTDHHWTTTGAFYGYKAWAESKRQLPRGYSPEYTEVVSEDFQGTLHSKVPLKTKSDKISIFPITKKLDVKLIYDNQRESHSFYEESYLETGNQYGYFLDDNHALVEIDTGNKNGRTLFLIKDSYANCMVPLLAFHYEKIYVVDLRYMNGPLFPFMEQCKPENGMDVLVLYNCIHFLEDFQYY